MASFNKITIVGYLGRDPELRYTPAGTAVCDFSMATSEKKGDADVTTWFRVTTWGKQADVAHAHLAKGSLVYIEGRVSMREYTDREGNKRTSLDVNATDLKFVGAKGETRAASAGASASDGAKADSSDGPPIDDDDIPF
jgi:single-strand DNA-binding protein